MQIVLHFILKYFDCNVYVPGVELKHDCSSHFFYHWYSMFYAKHYHLLVYFNEQQIYLATLGLVWYFNVLIHSIQLSFTWKWEVTKINPWIFKIFTHDRYCIYFLTEFAKFLDNFINLGWLSHDLGHHIFQLYI